MSNQRPSLFARPPGVRVLSEDEGHVAAMCNRVFVIVWKQAISLPAVIALGQTLREAAPASPGGRVGTFTVIERGYALPKNEARDQMVAAMRGSPIAFTLVVYEESGFVAAAIRGILTGMSLLVGPALPIHLSATVAEGALWVEKNAPSYATAAELEAGIRELRTVKR
jgi:hypothetical protein